MTPTPETVALRLRVLALRAVEQYVTNPTPIGWIEAEQVAIRLKRAQEATE